MKPNIIFILLDGCRQNRIHISEDFQLLKKNGTLIQNVTAALPYTVGAVNAIFSGLYGKDNGIDGYYKVLNLKESVKTMPEIFKENGYFTSCDLIHDKIVSKRGYDIHRGHEKNTDYYSTHIDLIKKSMEMANGKPIFSFLHYGMIHDVIVADVLSKFEWNNKNFYEQFEINLKKIDSLVVQSFSYAKKIKEDIEKILDSDNTIFIFFSDHGTGAGERYGERNYGSYTYEETIRTFYLFLGNEILKDQSSDELLSSIDIFPTILDICEINHSISLPGISFSEFLKKGKKIENKENYTFSETGPLHGIYPSPEESNVFCIKNERYKMMYFRTPNEWKLFDLVRDPKELQNLYGTGLEIESILEKKLLDWIYREVA